MGDIHVQRTNSKSKDFIALVTALDKDLHQRDGDEDHAYYAQFNKIDMIKNAVVVYENDAPVGCGAFKPFEVNTVEIKRMYVLPEARGKGYGSILLKALEDWAAELGHTRSLLETGLRQPEAIALYQKSGYLRIENYGQYIGVENSVCFEKSIES